MVRVQPPGGERDDRHPDEGIHGTVQLDIRYLARALQETANDPFFGLSNLLNAPFQKVAQRYPEAGDPGHVVSACLQGQREVRWMAVALRGRARPAAHERLDLRVRSEAQPASARRAEKRFVSRESQNIDPH